MPRPRQGELIECEFYRWVLRQRNGVFLADGRANNPSVGRHSLGTKDRREAIELVKHLDRTIAVKHGRIPASPMPVEPSRRLSLRAGRELYDAFVRRPRMAGGPKPATAKRYRPVLDHFLRLGPRIGVSDWNDVNRSVLERYAAAREKEGGADGTLYVELTTLKQVHKWLRKEGQLREAEPIDMPVSKQQGILRYCWRPEEFQAMMQHCGSKPALEWLRIILLGLATTGLRISELSELRWCDIDFEKNVLMLKDETATPPCRRRRAVRSTKTGRSRSFPLHTLLRETLEQLPRAADGQIFHAARGGRLKYDRIREAFVREILTPLAERFPTTEDLGFMDGRFHSFRHYFCSMCANSGVPETIVMRWLGHSSSRMVRHYYHLHDQESQRRMQQVDFHAGPREAGERSVLE